jgi:RNA polymerase sigma-70 factor (ECF subfamily)
VNPLRPSPDPEEKEILSSLARTGMARRKGEEQLFRKYKYFVREGMDRYTLSESDALDAYCDTILSLTGSPSELPFEGRSSLKTYLFRIFLNKCVDLVRKRTTNRSSVYRTEMITDQLQDLSDTGRTMLQHLIDKADHAWIRTLLESLGENCRKMLSFWAEGFSDKEISVELGYKTADVVKTSRLRCLDKLRQSYNTH